MLGFLFSIIAGAAMSLQGVINTRLSEKIGLYESNAWVQGTAFVLSMIALIFLRKTAWSEIGRGLGSINKFYLLGGVIGLVITITVMLAMSRLNPTLAVSAILISQLAVAALIDAFGWFGAEKIPFSLMKFVGLALMIGGVILFKKF